MSTRAFSRLRPFRLPIILLASISAFALPTYAGPLAHIKPVPVSPASPAESDPASPIATPSGSVRLPGHLPRTVLASSRMIGRLDSARTLSLSFVLPMRNQPEMDGLINDLYDPKSPNYRHYLTSEQITDRFGPTQGDYDRVVAFARSKGLTVVGTHPERTRVDVKAPVVQVERAFGLRMRLFRSSEDGHQFYAPDADPVVPASLAPVMTGVIGLSDASLPRPASLVSGATRGRRLSELLASYLLPKAGRFSAIGTGPYNGLSPSDIRQAYGLNGLPNDGNGHALDGTGQVIALPELQGFSVNDLRSYSTQFGLGVSLPSSSSTSASNQVTAISISIPGGPSGDTGAGGGPGTTSGYYAEETTLDIEMALALAPKAKILVYVAPPGYLFNAYSQIASDYNNSRKALQASTSLLNPDDFIQNGANMSTENSTFALMALQGQSMFAASGDKGAFADFGRPGSGNPTPGIYNVYDPASQPYICAVGGTTLTTSGGYYASETSWNVDATGANGGASGGGYSYDWGIPSWQAGVISPASQASTTMRNIPDVSLNADSTNAPYAVYWNGGWYNLGGTSASAPLWAAFTALVNQKRTTTSAVVTPLGFPNPTIYRIAQTDRYASDFHDVTSGYNDIVFNGTQYGFPAVTGYDDATGWGSFNGVNLLTDLAASGVFTAEAVSACPDGNTRILWPRSDGSASLWTVNPSGVRQSAYIFGPYTDSSGYDYTAKDLSVGPDGYSRVLWNESDPNRRGTGYLTGGCHVHVLDSSGNFVGNYLVGPLTAATSTLRYTPQAISVGPDNTTHILFDGNDNSIALVTISSGGTVSSPAFFGPYSGYTAAVSISVGSDGNTRVLWPTTTNGCALWCLNPSNAFVFNYQYPGPYSGWSPIGVTCGPWATDSKTRMLWKNVNGQMALWTMDVSTTTNTFVSNVFGPYSGFTVRGVSVAPDSNSRVLWFKYDGQTALWNLDTSASMTTNYQYGPYY